MCAHAVLTVLSLCTSAAPPLHTLPIAQLTVLSFSRRVLTLSLLTAIHLNSMLHGLTSPEKQDWRAQYRWGAALGSSVLLRIECAVGSYYDLRNRLWTTCAWDYDQ